MQYNGSLAYDLSGFSEEKSTGVKVKKAAKAKSASMIFFVFACAVYLTLLCGSLLVRTVKISEKSDELSKIKEEYTELVNENKQLEVSINTQIDLKKVEEIAIAKLNMNTPLKSQIIYINATPRDYGEVITPADQKKKKTGGIMGIIKAFTGMFAYSD